MSKLSIDNALNVLGIHQMPPHIQALDAAYQTALATYPSAYDPVSKSIHSLLEAAYLSLKNNANAAKGTQASDPDYAFRLAQALAWIAATPLSFEILGAWLWVSGTDGRSAAFEPQLRISGFEWASKKACWFLKPQGNPRSEAPRDAWDLERIRSTYAHRAA